MKKLSVILWLLVFLSIGRGVIDFVNSQTEAFQAYREQATAIAMERRHTPPYDEIKGRIVNVSYILLSIEHEDRHKLRLIAVQSVHFQKGSRLVNWEGRKIAKTRHDVFMIRNEGRWEISKIQEGTTTILSFGGPWTSE